MEEQIRITLESILDEHISEYTSDLSKLASSIKLKNITVLGKEYTPEVWSEKEGSSDLIVASLSSKKFLGVYSMYCLGALLDLSNNLKYLNEEDLWKRGIP